MEENVDVTKLKVADLKKLLREKGLPVTGTKNQLLERLQGHLEGGAGLETVETDNSATVEATDESQENIETDLLATDDSYLLEESPNKTEKPTEIVESVHKTESSGVVINKIVFDTELPQEEVLKKRAEKFGLQSDEDKKNKRAEKFGLESDDDKKNKRAEKFGLQSDEDKKNIRAEKFGLQSDEDKKNIRAEKFGLQSDEDKKNSRAKRFGTIAAPSNNESDKNNPDVTITKVTSPVLNRNEQVDKLKRRAERFGQVVSDTLSQIDSLERKKKRKERFGEVLVSHTKSNISDDERIKIRDERFGSADKKSERAKRFGLT